MAKFVAYKYLMQEFLIIDTAWGNTIALHENCGVNIFNWFPNLRYRHYGNPPNLDEVSAKFKNAPGKKILILDSWSFDNLGILHGKTFDLSFADLVIFMSAELCGQGIEFHEQLSKQINNDNCIYITTGYNLSNNPMPKSMLHYDYYWFERILEANKPVEYDNASNRKYLFDALLGSKKWHRNEIFNNLARLNLITSSLVSLHDSFFDLTMNGQPSYETPELLSLENEYVRKFKEGALTEADKYSGYSINELTTTAGFKPRMSCIMSENIFKNSWYSIIAETNYIPDLLFASEKTAKAIFAKRVFVMFANMGHLKWLRELGFQTFDGIIDESYDLIKSPEERIQATVEQIMFLSTSDPIQIYEKAKPIIDHNYNFMSTLTEKNANDIREFIRPHVDKLR